MSAMASKATVVWLRDELRVHDNALLAEAAKRGAPVLPVFCLDPRVFDASANRALSCTRSSSRSQTTVALLAMADIFLPRSNEFGAAREWAVRARASRLVARRIRCSQHPLWVLSAAVRVDCAELLHAR